MLRCLGAHVREREHSLPPSQQSLKLIIVVLMGNLHLDISMQSTLQFIGSHSPKVACVHLFLFME